VCRNRKPSFKLRWSGRFGRQLGAQQGSHAVCLRDTGAKRLAQPRPILLAPGAQLGDGDVFGARTDGGGEAIRRDVFDGAVASVGWHDCRARTNAVAVVAERPVEL
jgi:hypothetical protein